MSFDVWFHSCWRVALFFIAEVLGCNLSIQVGGWCEKRNEVKWRHGESFKWCIYIYKPEITFPSQFLHFNTFGDQYAPVYHFMKALKHSSAVSVTSWKRMNAPNAPPPSKDTFLTRNQPMDRYLPLTRPSTSSPTFRSFKGILSSPQTVRPSGPMWRQNVHVSSFFPGQSSLQPLRNSIETLDKCQVPPTKV